MTQETNASNKKSAQRESSDVMDVDALIERCMGNIDFVMRVLDRFQQRFPEELDELEEAASLRDAQRIAMLAHRIKGESATASASKMQQTLDEIEEMSLSGRVEEIPVRIKQLRGEWAVYRDYSASHLPKVRPE